MFWTVVEFDKVRPNISLDRQLWCANVSIIPRMPEKCVGLVAFVICIKAQIVLRSFRKMNNLIAHQVTMIWRPSAVGFARIFSAFAEGRIDHLAGSFPLSDESTQFFNR